MYMEYPHPDPLNSSHERRFGWVKPTVLVAAGVLLTALYATPTGELHQGGDTPQIHADGATTQTGVFTVTAEYVVVPPPYDVPFFD